MGKLMAFRIILRRAAEAQHKSREWHDYGVRCERTPDLTPSRIQAQKNARAWSDEAQQLVTEFWMLWRAMKEAHIRALSSPASSSPAEADTSATLRRAVGTLERIKAVCDFARDNLDRTDADLLLGALQDVRDAFDEWLLSSGTHPRGFRQSTGSAEIDRAREIADSPAVMSVFAAPEFDELSEDGKAWVAAIVGETERRSLTRGSGSGSSSGEAKPCGA